LSGPFVAVSLGFESRAFGRQLRFQIVILDLGNQLACGYVITFASVYREPADHGGGKFARFRCRLDTTAGGDIAIRGGRGRKREPGLPALPLVKR
jgi:hypothetical protein